MNCARCIHYAVCPYDAIMHDETKWETKKCVHFVDESEVKKVVRGEWAEGLYGIECTNCGREVVYHEGGDGRWRYECFCPHCGADMRGEKNET